MIFLLSVGMGSISSVTMIESEGSLSAIDIPPYDERGIISPT